MKQSDLEKHKKHLAVVPDAVVKKRMAGFRLKNVELTPLPFICQSIVVQPIEKYIDWLHPLDPVTLDDLKNWFGVPNELAQRMAMEQRVVCQDGQLWSGASRITPAALPRKSDWTFAKLDNEEREAVQQVSKNLLYGYVAPESLSSPAIEGVVQHMLASARKFKLKILVAKDLIVCPDDVVEFKGIAALYFNNILVYGNGKIKTSNTATFHSHQLKRVP